MKKISFFLISIFFIFLLSIKGKNSIISTCLSYYESKELASIAQKLYKQKVKEDKKIWRK
ncbi:hypothetical protein N0B16_06670 [Chryseobacterium sp. GMJ5]|uniref:Uncharacterized protein n=1 Tax=Chryseobacterium gilvum TaxID=2976534 RepID=A0ABT2VVU0_9FLAO|nr:hypothetical protein [Chryseobacterium gilvum]